MTHRLYFSPQWLESIYSTSPHSARERLEAGLAEIVLRFLIRGIGPYDDDVLRPHSRENAAQYVAIDGPSVSGAGAHARCDLPQSARPAAPPVRHRARVEGGQPSDLHHAAVGDDSERPGAVSSQRIESRPLPRGHP